MHAKFPENTVNNKREDVNTESHVWDSSKSQWITTHYTTPDTMADVGLNVGPEIIEDNAVQSIVYSPYVIVWYIFIKNTRVTFTWTYEWLIIEPLSHMVLLQLFG